MADKGDSKQLLDSLAVVLPRYGESLGGGAETLVRALVQQMVRPRGDRYRGALVKRIEVWTTCAVDHRTWENHYEPGDVEEDGLVVRRFPVSERDLEPFINFELSLQQGRPLDLDAQLDWLGNGVNSSELYQHIARYGREFDAILFAPYLFATTFWGALIMPERSLLVPCLHNEAYAYLDVFHHLFRTVRGFLFNSAAEMALADALYDIDDFQTKATVVGMGFDLPQTNGTASRSLSSATGATGSVPFLLYSGRKETGKNLDFLIQCFVHFRSLEPKSKLELRIIGSGTIDFLDQLPDGVYDLGFVSEEEKERLMNDAIALCQPSVNESFSIVMMEAWLRQTPVLVNGECAVTKEHVVQSGGGLYFSSEEEFGEVVSLLLNDEAVRHRMGTAGLNYVKNEYSWDAVTDRLADAFCNVGLIEFENRVKVT